MRAGLSAELGWDCHRESRLRSAQGLPRSKEESLTCPAFHYKGYRLFVHHHTRTSHPEKASRGVRALWKNYQSTAVGISFPMWMQWQ